MNVRDVDFFCALRNRALSKQRTQLYTLEVPPQGGSFSICVVVSYTGGKGKVATSLYIRENKGGVEKGLGNPPPRARARNLNWIFSQSCFFSLCCCCCCCCSFIRVPEETSSSPLSLLARAHLKKAPERKVTLDKGSKFVSLCSGPIFWASRNSFLMSHAGGGGEKGKRDWVERFFQVQREQKCKFCCLFLQCCKFDRRRLHSLFHLKRPTLSWQRGETHFSGWHKKEPQRTFLLLYQFKELALPNPKKVENGCVFFIPFSRNMYRLSQSNCI